MRKRIKVIYGVLKPGSVRNLVLPHVPMPYESPTSVVKHDLLSLSVRPRFSSEMTSENASGDVSQGIFCRNRLSQIPDFFFLNERVRGVTGDPVHSGL